MRIRHVVGAAATAVLIAVAGPAATSQAGTGSFTYYVTDGNHNLLDNPEPYVCYTMEEPAIGGHNSTVFAAKLYADISCGHSLNQTVPAGAGFDTRMAHGVKFVPANSSSPAPPPGMPRPPAPRGLFR